MTNVWCMPCSWGVHTGRSGKEAPLQCQEQAALFFRTRLVVAAALASHAKCIAEFLAIGCLFSHSFLFFLSMNFLMLISKMQSLFSSRA